jgi:hypothetical protein
MKFFQSCIILCMSTLFIACGGSSSDSSSDTETPSNSVPIANAGSDNAVATGESFSLDGTASSDADSDALTYVWSISSAPGESSAVLSVTTNVQPDFTADVDGSYTFSLTVNDGTVDSASDEVSVVATTATIQNVAPIANAGIDNEVVTGDSFSLDGSASSDADNDDLTYAWILTEAPSGSSATLSDMTAAQPSFIADIDGSYTFSLSVNDGTEDSPADTVTIMASTTNIAPVADAGVDQEIETGVTVTLDASTSSDANSDTLTYLWALTTKPSTSTATLSNSTAEALTFVADISGEYIATLIVNDGTEDSPSDTITITASASADFYTPAPIVEALQLTRDHTWAELASTPVDLTRFSMGPAGDTSILTLVDESNSISSELLEVSGLASVTSSTDDILLRSMFQFIEIEDDVFRIVTAKHSNYALDVDNQGVTDNLIIRDFRSINNIDTSTAGYLTFTISGSSPMLLSASGRKTYDTSTDAYIDDSTWTTKEVLLTSGALTLTSSAGTSMTIYSPPINFEIPADFNPDETARVSNEELTPITKEDAISGTASKIVSAYADQVTATGENADTTAAAEAMLSTIETTLAAEGSQLRYPADFYITFRAGLFSRTVQSADATDSTLGQATVPYVFFTNEADADGVHHPFMVIASYGIPDSLALLWDVAKPPGDGGAGIEYEDQSVTRSFHRESFLMKIPLRDYGEVESLTENDMNSDLATDAGETDLTHHNYASLSATGVAIDGVVIYPTFNNALHVVQADAEISAHGMHSGKGLGLHYHADAHSATEEGLNLYNSSDYTGHTHPPIVSMGFDGVAGYGLYQSGDTTSDGINIDLDSFGGHEHGNYGYHYHSFTATETTAAGAGPTDPVGEVEYTKHMLPPLGAWSGRINDIPEFWDNTVPNYVGGNSVYLGTEE